VVFDEGTDTELKYYDVDSISCSELGWPVLLFGSSKPQGIKLWYYVTGAPREFKNPLGGFYDGEFRKYRLKEIELCYGPGFERYNQVTTPAECLKSRSK
jgi:hypothetical protein